jgi:hypothetical protein
MNQVYNTNNRKLSLYVTVKCNGKSKFKICAEDYGKKNSLYCDRVIEVENERTIYISFPISPKYVNIIVTNENDSKDFTFTIEEKPLKEYNVWLDSDSVQFSQFAITFAQTCGFNIPSKEGVLYSTHDKRFNIKYFQNIVSNGKVLNTPARIGHNTGLIEISAAKFLKYTIPMRLCILLHEFSHKYRNPKMGLDISDEIGADINALYIYLGLGFSKIDAICVFSEVFLKAQSDVNIKRIRKIKEYIAKFENEEVTNIL